MNYKNDVDVDKDQQLNSNIYDAWIKKSLTTFPF